MGEVREQRTFCRFCIAVCGAVVEVDDEQQVLKVRGDEKHPTSRGYLCPKGRALGIAHHDPRRLDHPLMGRLSEQRQASWDACLDDAGAALREVIDRHGPSSVAFLVGNGGSFDASGRWTFERLQRRLGSKTKYTNMTVDTPAKPVVSTMMSGFPFLVPAIDHERATMTVLVGCNPVVSHGHMNSFPDPVRHLRALAEQGELWVIDPRETETATLATHHLAIRPGSDWALMAHTVREVIRDGADHEYIDGQVDGVDELTRAVESFDIERTSELTGLAAESIEGFVAAVRRHRRIAIQTGTGTTFSTRGTVTEWLVWALSLITGSYDRPGGMWFQPGFFKQYDQREIARMESSAFGAGPASRPDLPNVTGEMPASAFADEVEAGNVRAVIVAGLNPITAFPNLDRQKKALESLDVVVVADVVSSELTDRATHVLPVSGPLERADLTYYADFLMNDVSGNYTPRVVEPGAERRPQWQALAQLGARLGLSVLGDGIDPDTIDEEDVIDLVGRGARRSIDELRNADTAVVAETSVFGWVTERILASGKWNAAPAPFVANLAELVARPAPTVPPSPSPSAGVFSLISARQVRHVNFQLTGVALGGGNEDRPALQMNTADAKALGVDDGGAVRVRSAIGHVDTHVEITDRIRTGVVALPQGFQAVNVTALVGDKEIDSLSGMPLQTAIPVTVELR